MGDEPEVRGLLALMLLTDSRRDTRVDAAGRLVLLADQDRDRWDQAQVLEGLALVHDLHHSRVGRFGLQAAIAAEHAVSPSYAETRWGRVVALYDALLREWPSPVVELNRAVALAELAGPEVALAEVDRLTADRRLAGYRYLPATRADLLRRLGRDAEAASSYDEALTLTDNEAERAFLTRRRDDARRR
jgi:RNA polymerase sigma-70 factor (ECF subfamily)